MRRIFQFATLLLWLGLPMVANVYRQAWDQLPARLATHFNAAGQANGWMPRQEAVNFGVGFVAFLLVIFTVLLLYSGHKRVDSFSWALFAFCGLVLGLIVEVNRGIVNYNLFGTALDVGPLLILVPIAAVLLVVIYIAARREPPLPSSGSLAADLLAEETHSGGVWSMVIVVALIGPAIGVALAPSGVRFPLIIAGLLGVGACAMTLSGFQYRFLRHGVEIRTLGFRLRAIPRQSIVSYAVEPWAFVRGYGIRGIGNTRAYVWCNKVVHIKTSNGDIFLGHNDPERVVHDLDMVMGAGTQAGN